MDSNIHVLYTNREACEDDERLIRLGTRMQSSQWLWNELAYEDDCDGPYQESFTIDPGGRVWAQSGSSGVHVFAPPAAMTTNSTMRPIANHSTSNSAYNGMPIELVGDQVLAVNPFEGNAVGIDTSNPKFASTASQGSIPYRNSVAPIIVRPELDAAASKSQTVNGFRPSCLINLAFFNPP